MWRFKFSSHSHVVPVFLEMKLIPNCVLLVPSTALHVAGNDDNDNDTPGEVHPTIVGGLALQERRGHDPAKKSLLKLAWLALLARFAPTHQYIKSPGETQAVAGTNSLNSSRWNPRIRCNTTKGDPGRQDSRRKCVAGTAAHERTIQECLTPFQPEQTHARSHRLGGGGWW